MSLKGIIAVTGMPGLYKVLTQTKTGFIVESLTDQKRLPVSASQRVSMLEEISIYTTSGDVPLKEVFLKIAEYSTGNEITDAKADPKQLMEFLRRVVPDFDSDRVYPSDIKKMITWFHLVKGLLEKEDEPGESTPQEKPSEAAGE